MALQMQKAQPFDAVFGQVGFQNLQIAQGHGRQGGWVIRKSVKVSITAVGVHNCPVIPVEKIILYILVLMHLMRHGIPF